MSTRVAMRITLKLLPVILIVGCGGGGGIAGPTFNETFAEGLREYRAGNYDYAVGMFKSAAEYDAERPEPSYQIGRCYLAMADRQFVENDLPAALRYCDRAVASFDMAIGAFPGYSRAVQGKADALKLKNKHEAAQDIANWVTQQSAFVAQKQILKARQFAASGDLDNAELTLRKAVAIEPDNAAAHAELGLFYMRLNNTPRAIRSLTRAYELDPGAAGVLAALIQLKALPPYPTRRSRR